MKNTTIAVLLMGLSATVSWAGDLPAQQAAQMHQELSTSMQKMHDDMHKGMMSNDPDVAFAAGMLPHHIGAVEMAKTELKYGTDPQMRKLAQSISKRQRSTVLTLIYW
ncbi:CopM family metallochaperone [Salmonella enterica]|uniref:CopM family metallochaperone n=1 Tax=Salmonella enterica TaxID=28901 RepID=UPI003D2E9D12